MATSSSRSSARPAGVGRVATRSKHSRAALGVFLLLALSGCDRCGASSEEGPQRGGGASGDEEAPHPHSGTVVGVVKLAEGATLPAYTEEEVGRTGEAERLSMPEMCTAHSEEDLRPVKMHDDSRGIGPVMVTATGDPETFFEHIPDYEPIERTFTIENCRLEPSFMVAMKGDTVVLRNETAHPFTPHVGPTAFYQSLLEGQTRRVELGHGGVPGVVCGYGHPCGRAELAVILNPIFTTTDAAGHFELRNVPADQEVTIHAWHPLFRENAKAVTVEEGESVRVELTLAPNPARELGSVDEEPRPDDATEEASTDGGEDQAAP